MNYTVFPAPAGLNRFAVALGMASVCVPRTRGAEPRTATAISRASRCSPHPRG